MPPSLPDVLTPLMERTSREHSGVTRPIASRGHPLYRQFPAPTPGCAKAMATPAGCTAMTPGTRISIGPPRIRDRRRRELQITVRREIKNRSADLRPTIKPRDPVVALFCRARCQHKFAQLGGDSSSVIKFSVDPRHDLRTACAQIAFLLVGLKGFGGIVGRSRGFLGQND